MKICCCATSCDLQSMDACCARRPRMYLFEGGAYCEEHYLAASRLNQPNAGNLIWDFERGYSGMFPHTMNAAEAFAKAVNRPI